jgi:hypothetical protein
MRVLSAARTAVMTAVAEIDADMRRTTRASPACWRLMTIPRRRAVDRARLFGRRSSRIRRSRDIGAYFGLVPRRYQSGEIDYTCGISKCEGCSGSPPHDHHACVAARWDGLRIDLSPRIPGDRRPNRAPARSEARGREQTTARIL